MAGYQISFPKRIGEINSFSSHARMCVYVSVYMCKRFVGMQYECGQSEMVANLGTHFEQSISTLSAPVTEQEGKFSVHYLQDSSVSIKSCSGN